MLSNPVITFRPSKTEVRCDSRHNVAISMTCRWTAPNTLFFARKFVFVADNLFSNRHCVNKNCIALALHCSYILGQNAKRTIRFPLLRFLHSKLMRV